MKTISLIILLMQLLPYKPQSEYVNGLSMHSEYFSFNPHVYFRVKLKGDGIVELRINAIREKILSPVFIFTHNGNFTLDIKEWSDNGFVTCQIPIRRGDYWKSIQSNITRIDFKTNKKWYSIPINSNLKQLKEFAK